MTILNNEMKKLFLYILVMACMVFSRESAFAQRDSLNLITLELKDAGIEELVVALEKQTHLHFDYDASQFDSIKFSLNVKQQPLNGVLEQAFAQTDFQFSIAQPDYAFITKGKQINT